VGAPSTTTVCNNIYLQFVREGRGEIEILRYLTGINLTSNHIITGVVIWPVRRRNVISMPMVGTWLITEINNRNVQLWSVAKQLFEAIDFMHQHSLMHHWTWSWSTSSFLWTAAIWLSSTSTGLYTSMVSITCSVASSTLMYIFPMLGFLGMRLGLRRWNHTSKLYTSDQVFREGQAELRFPCILIGLLGKFSVSHNSHCTNYDL